MGRIAIVSNRLPATQGDGESAGGLAVSLRAALEESGGTWFGWDGTITSEGDDAGSTRQTNAFGIVSLSLSETEHAGHYLGFSNRTLWPLLHGRPDLGRYDASEFATYRRVNTRFAKHLAARAEDHELIWVHDYHFFLLGRELRRLGLEMPIGFILHVPFPSPDVLLTLPCHREIVEALAMSLDERRERWSDMITGLRDYDVHAWRDAFLGTLSVSSRRHSATRQTASANRASNELMARKKIRALVVLAAPRDASSRRIKMFPVAEASKGRSGGDAAMTGDTERRKA